MFSMATIHKSENKLGLNKSKNNSTGLKYLSALKSVHTAPPHRPFHSIRGMYVSATYAFDDQVNNIRSPPTLNAKKNCKQFSLI